MSDPTVRPFKHIAGHPALDFANTADRWDDGIPSGELLGGYADLVAWAESVGLLDRRMARTLVAEAGHQPRAADRALARARELRALIYRLFAAAGKPRRGAAADLAALNAALAGCLPHRRLAASDDGFSWTWEDLPSLDRPLWPVLHGAATLLASDLLPRVRVCGGERCHWLFLDETKNHSRRWCDMSVCGNRAKARRHHDRARRESAG